MNGRTASDILTEREVQELAAAFVEPSSARRLLESAGLPPSRQPNVQGLTADEFWSDVNALLRSGVLADGAQRVLAAASRWFPANPVFASRGEGAVALSGIERVGPVNVTVLAVDAVGFSRHGTLVQLAWRQGIREVFDSALKAAGIPNTAVRAEDRGDGYMTLFSSDVPKPKIIADFVRELGICLGHYNRTRNADGRIRLRVAAHHGEVVTDSTGFAGDAVVVAARLLDSRPIRESLAKHDTADLALIISDDLFRAVVVERFRGLSPDDFEQSPVQMKKFSGTAWVWVPGGAPGPVTTHVTAGAATPSTATPPPAGATPAGATPSAAADSVAAVQNWDFLVSYAPDHESWAEWIAWELEATGYRVHVEALDAVAGTSDTRRLHEAVRGSNRTLAVLSRSYLRSAQVQAEWQAAWSADPLGMQRTLIPIRVEECQPDGLLRGIRDIDLTGLDEDTARHTLITEIEASLHGRRPRRDSPPKFPPDHQP